MLTAPTLCSLIGHLPRGATVAELVAALKPWSESSVKSALYWDVAKVKGYGVRTETDDKGHAAAVQLRDPLLAHRRVVDREGGQPAIEPIHVRTMFLFLRFRRPDLLKGAVRPVSGRRPSHPNCRAIRCHGLPQERPGSAMFAAASRKSAFAAGRIRPRAHKKSRNEANMSLIRNGSVCETKPIRCETKPISSGTKPVSSGTKPIGSVRPSGPRQPQNTGMMCSGSKATCSPSTPISAGAAACYRTFAGFSSGGGPLLIRSWRAESPCVSAASAIVSTLSPCRSASSASHRWTWS